MSDLQLRKPTFHPLPLGSVRPLGWLARQLRIQADGISGNLDLFWPDIRDSAWFGGTADGWERAPYWLDGVVPLAYLLDDKTLIGRVEAHLDHILTHQHEDGWLGPRPENPARHDLWPLLLILKPLIQYSEATGDERVAGAVGGCLRCLEKHIQRNPLSYWGQFRWFEALIGIYWLYERTAEPWLLDLAVTLKSQGFDWPGFFMRWPLRDPTTKGDWNYMGHVVNNAMAIKAPGLWWRLTGNPVDRDSGDQIMAALDRHHGMVSGVFTGDECLAGTKPTQGTELCAMVEHMFSLETVLGLFGQAHVGDRLERIAYNALPATFSPDMWSHQYDQQVNQIACVRMAEPPWNTNGPDANTFGVEPNYGCCTANLSQGWPKFAAHLWMTSLDGGLAAAAYAPSEAWCHIDGTRVHVELATDYPFREDLTFTLNPDHPVTFPLHLRIPGWCDNASVHVPDGETLRPTPGTFARITRQWSKGDVVSLTLPMGTRSSHGHSGAVRLERGPLVYALPIEESWQRVNLGVVGREPPHADWEVRPTGPWNYALCLQNDAPELGLSLEERPLGPVPFSPAGAPIRATAQARKLPAWKGVDGCAEDVPDCPVATEEPPEQLRLVPFGCTNLRIAEFPWREA